VEQLVLKCASETEVTDVVETYVIDNWKYFTDSFRDYYRQQVYRE